MSWEKILNLKIKNWKDGWRQSREPKRTKLSRLAEYSGNLNEWWRDDLVYSSEDLVYIVRLTSNEAWTSDEEFLALMKVKQIESCSKSQHGNCGTTRSVIVLLKTRSKDYTRSQRKKTRGWLPCIPLMSSNRSRIIIVFPATWNPPTRKSWTHCVFGRNVLVAHLICWEMFSTWVIWLMNNDVQACGSELLNNLNPLEFSLIKVFVGLGQTPEQEETCFNEGQL